MSKETHTADKLRQDVRIFIALVVCILGYIFLYGSVSDLIAGVKAYKATALVLIAATPWLAFACTKSYRVSEKGISIRRFGIQYRFIPWERIDHIGVYEIGRFDKMIITLKGCERYPVNSYYPYTLYSWRHPIKVINIYNVWKGRPVIEKYYGPLDYEPAGAKKASLERESAASDAPETVGPDAANVQQQSRPAEKIGPCWWPMIYGVELGIGCCIFLFIDVDSIFDIAYALFEITALDIILLYFLYIALSLVFKSAKTFRVSERGISIRRFGIPYRFIRWERVDQIVYYLPIFIHGKVFITLVDRKRRKPLDSHFSLKLYQFRHPIKVITVYNAEQGCAVLEKYYGHIERKNI